MPRKIEYPRASLSRTLELASAVEALGGRSSLDMAAQKVKMKLGGAFYSLVAAGTKYGLLASEGKGANQRRLVTTSLYRQYRLAYNDNERTEVLQSAALAPPVFNELYTRFIGVQIPHEYLDKLLVREYGVTETEASRVGSYLIEALQAAGLMDDDFRVLEAASTDSDGSDSSAPEPAESQQGQAHGGDSPRSRGGSAASGQPRSAPPPQDHYEISVRGPDFDTTIAVHELDDFDLVDAVINRVRRKVQKPTNVNSEPEDQPAGEEKVDDIYE